MSDLKDSLSRLKEFYQAVSVGSSNLDLKLKKQKAGDALKHLEMLIGPEPEPEDDGCGRKQVVPT
jgi:hypothetical protein